MDEINNYDDEVEESTVDDDEAQAAEKGAKALNEDAPSDVDLAEAETLTVTAKNKQRQALEDEVAAFLARGGKITEVPPDHSQHD